MIEDMWKQKKGKKVGLFHSCALRLVVLQKKMERNRGGRKTGNRQGQEILCRIWGRETGALKYWEFQVRKTERLLAILSAGLAMALLCQVFLTTGGLEPLTELLRPDSGEGDRTYVLDAEVGDEKLRRISVSVPEQELSEEEASALLDQAQVELERWVAAIPNPDSVEDDLDLPERFCGGLVTGSWQSDCYDLMDASGQIRKQWVEEGGELVVLSVRLQCVEQERECSFAVRIVPKGDSLADRLMRETGRQLEAERSLQQASAALPETLEEQPVKWRLHQEPYGLWILCLTIAGTGLISFAYDHDLEKEGEARQEELALAYPSFLARLTLLAQTGMPIRQIFARLSKEKNGVVYEEVRRTFREMESGMTQTEALERFGKRTRLPQYKKCAALLAQNIRRGTGELITALGQEAENAFEEQKAAARRKAEEAQTKLLFPMLLMLSVVMILILVPAWLSFGGL